MRDKQEPYNAVDVMCALTGSKSRTVANLWGQMGWREAKDTFFIR